MMSRLGPFGKRSSEVALAKLLLLGIFPSSAVFAASGANKDPLPSSVLSAKSIYLVNETSDAGLLNAASEQFNKWGRFTTVDSGDQADLVIKFRSKNGLDKWGNGGFLVMSVLPRSSNQPAFETKSAVHIIWDRENRTKLCISDFRKYLESQH